MEEEEEEGEGRTKHLPADEDGFLRLTKGDVGSRDEK